MAVSSIRTSGLGGSKYFRMSKVAGISLPPLNWEHLYWTGGNRFSDLNKLPGDSISSWPDEINNNDLLCGSATLATSSTFNGEQFVRLGSALQSSVMATPCSAVFVIFNMSSVSSTFRWHDNQGSGGGGRWVMGTYGGAWQIYFGTTAGQNVTATGGPHSALYYQNGSNDRLEIDGSLIYGPSDYGTSTMSRLNIVNLSIDVDIVLLGIYNGDPTLDANWSEFKSTILQIYGISA